MTDTCISAHGNQKALLDIDAGPVSASCVRAVRASGDRWDGLRIFGVG